jgi:Histidine kinase-, DNA gyrase B-, and HSP90-like ATPase
MPHTSSRPYKMTISLNVLNHLGIKLYSNVPAVLSEIVANAWDADATEVTITIKTDSILIEDNGQGMSLTDINDRYLLVGYEKRKELTTTAKYKRPVMGRKGIGKLSLFSVASKAVVETRKNGKKFGLVLSANKITSLLGKAKVEKEYYPEALKDSDIKLAKSGTRITISGLKKGINAASVSALKKRIARRFSIIGREFKFTVKINGEEVKVTDRDYFHKIQYIWYFGSASKSYADLCDADRCKKREKRPDSIKVGKRTYKVSGWIGTVSVSGELKDDDDENLNKIVIMVRGKLAQEDIIEDFAEGGVYTKYLIGELHADFLDLDTEEDIATTNRQEIIKDAERYKALQNFVRKELKAIQQKWTGYRNDEGVKEALKNEAIRSWFGSLKPVTKKRAENLFGKINHFPIKEDEKKVFFKHAVLAFESLRYKENLDALDRITPENVALFASIFAEHNDIEATLYHQIIKARIQVIKILQDKVDTNALEKVVQKHLYENLWLLDPAWDRATETPSMEQSVKKAFEDLDAKLTGDEKKARFDIKYKNSAGKHIIIELKRAKRIVKTTEVVEQLQKYQNTLQKLLDKAGRGKEPIEAVCIVGEKLSDWLDERSSDKSIGILKAANIRVVLYQELIDNAYRQYSAFVEKDHEVGRIYNLLRDIDDTSVAS